MFNTLNRINAVMGVMMLGYYTVHTAVNMYKNYKFEKSLKS